MTKPNVVLAASARLARKDNMKYVMLILLAAVLTGCANTETQRCRKVDGVTVCDEERPNPREFREPRGGRGDL